jgi:beta-phosphoglucomutase-like phosphatase (HAD superfamily)
VYLEAARRLGVDPADCLAVEDSTNGLLSAHAAGMRVIAVPDPRYPPSREALDVADEVLDSLHALLRE